MTKILALIGLMVAPLPAMAWGAEGHEIVAGIALRELTPRAREQVAALLGSDAMMVHESNWADEVRSQRPETGPWHFVDIPLQARGYDAARDCAGGNCVVAQIDAARHVLGDKHAAPVVRREALRFLIHFVADVHQPLHDVDNNDRGGNRIYVELGRDRTNLHHIWDTQVVQALGEDEDEIAAELDHAVTRQERKEWDTGTPVDWANQAHTIARDAIYPAMGGRNHVRMPPNYPRLAEPLTRLQLSRAGIRLAWILNTTLK